MPNRYIPINESEQKFSELVERVMKDEEFAKSIEANPAETLKKAGYHVTQQQAAKLSAHEAIALPAIVRPVVNVITRGTRPVVSVVTRGTRPAVQVVTGTIVAVQESPAKTVAAADVQNEKS